MKIEILNRPQRPYEVCAGDQIVGIIRKERFGWRFHRFVFSWDGWNPAHVKQIESMADNKIAVLTAIDRLTQ